MPASIVSKVAKDAAATPAAFNFGLLDRGGDGASLAPLHALLKADGTLINPATAEGLAAIVSALAGTLGVSAASLPLPAGAATQATLASILTVLQGQRSETLWTDDAGAYYVRVLHGDTLLWTDPTGTAATPGTGLRPEADGGAIVACTSFQATAGGTGFASGDYLDHVVTVSDKGVVLGNVWLNVTGGTKLATTPSSGAISPVAVLPTGAATDAKVEAVRALLAGTLTVGLPTGAATATNQGTGNASLASLDGKLPAKGAAAAAASTPVVLAIDGLLTAASPGTVIQQPFRPVPGATKSVAAGPTATTAGALPLAATGVIPAGSATSYRVRNASASTSPLTFVLTTDATKVPVIPSPYSAAGTGGTLGDKTVDPGSVEIFSLSPAQQAALAAGTLYLSVVAPAGGSGVLSVTPGTGG